MEQPPDRRARLTSARDRLAGAIDDCQSMRDLPSLVREYRAVMAELDSLPNTAEVSDADEIAARRAARRAGSSSKARAAGKG